MASVVFFRAVNVGGHQTFRPSSLAKELADLGVVNVGAAGTFVVREQIGQAVLRAEVLHRLPFKPELMICPGRDVLALARGKWFREAPAGKVVNQFVSVMQKAPDIPPPLPLDQPAGNKWEIRVVAVTGKFALSLRRPGPKGVYANAVVEEHFGIPATTRNWNTLSAVCEILEK